MENRLAVVGIGAGEGAGAAVASIMKEPRDVEMVCFFAVTRSGYATLGYNFARWTG